MATFLLNFDADILDSVRTELQPTAPAWIELSVAQQVALLQPYVQAQARRDERRRKAA